MAVTSLASAKAHLSELVASAQLTHERTVITKNGQPAAVIIGADDWESIQETMSWLPQLDEIRQALQEPAEPLTREELMDALARRSRTDSE